ncbi:hypothetical protein MMC16_001950 [Acarospora aff. strigata]|nr:hypothetical protein [Acarospora aff. strigata]
MNLFDMEVGQKEAPPVLRRILEAAQSAIFIIRSPFNEQQCFEQIRRFTVMLWSSITGTRPGVLLPKLGSSAAQSTSGANSVDGTLSQGQDPPTIPTTRGLKRNEAFQE